MDAGIRQAWSLPWPMSCVSDCEGQPVLRGNTRLGKIPVPAICLLCNIMVQQWKLVQSVKYLTKRPQTDGDCDETSNTSGKYAVVATFCIILLVVSQQVLVVDTDTRLGRALLNAAHTPWFFLVSILLWIAIQHLKKYTVFQRLAIYVFASLGLATLLEATQMFNAREASWEDILANVLGSLSAILMVWALRSWRKARLGTSFVYGALAIAVVLVAFKEVNRELWLRFIQLEQAPILVDFQNSPRNVLATVRGTWKLVNGVGWPGFEGQQVARIALTGPTRYPGIILQEPLQDWRPYRELVITGYVPNGTALDLDVRLETFSSSGLGSIYTTHLAPGSNEVRISLSDLNIRDASLHNVRNLYLYKERGAGEGFYWLASLALE